MFQGEKRGVVSHQAVWILEFQKLIWSVWIGNFRIQTCRGISYRHSLQKIIIKKKRAMSETFWTTETRCLSRALCWRLCYYGRLTHPQMRICFGCVTCSSLAGLLAAEWLMQLREMSSTPRRGQNVCKALQGQCLTRADPGAGMAASSCLPQAVC